LQRQVLRRVSKSDRDVTASGCDLIRLVTLVVFSYRILTYVILVFSLLFSSSL
jgi:hypothetical protein